VVPANGCSRTVPCFKFRMASSANEEKASQPLRFRRIPGAKFEGDFA
jgi:hypothetical protein